jgi:hypothetical protein
MPGPICPMQSGPACWRWSRPPGPEPPALRVEHAAPREAFPREFEPEPNTPSIVGSRGLVSIGSPMVRPDMRHMWTVTAGISCGQAALVRPISHERPSMSPMLPAAWAGLATTTASNHGGGRTSPSETSMETVIPYTNSSRGSDWVTSEDCCTVQDGSNQLAAP